MSRLPRHVGFIPDGNRRWAQSHGLEKQQGYSFGLKPGLTLFEACCALEIEEVSVYGFTKDNTHRASEQKHAFVDACVAMAEQLERRGAALLVIGDEHSMNFPAALKRFRTRQGRGIKVNLLANYDWQWDIDGLREAGRLQSHDVSRLDLVVRWGGGCRLSGFLPVQSVYADIHVIEECWPSFEIAHFEQALAWFARQDRTLGG